MGKINKGCWIVEGIENHEKELTTWMLDLEDELNSVECGTQ